jgi:hypothetical protein
MSPPEVWGPAVWILFHTLTEKINENASKKIFLQLFNNIVRICKFLPCPDCSDHASKFLSTIKINDIRNKNDLKNIIYLFHNKVNYRKKKQLFNYSNINIYQKYNIINVINNFIEKYQTKGNMKLLTDSFQRKLIITDFKKWIQSIFIVFSPILLTQKHIKNKIIEPNLQEDKAIEDIEDIKDIEDIEAN